MESVILVIHLLIIIAMVAAILLQRTEGGALGIGGSGAGGSMFGGRGTANLLTRLTAGLAAAFFATSILLTMISRGSIGPESIFDTIPGPAAGQTEEGRPTDQPILPRLPDTQPAPEQPRVPLQE